MEQFQEKELGKALDFHLLKRLMGYTKKWFPLIIVSALLLLVSTLSYLFQPRIIQTIIDQYLSPTEVSISAGDEFIIGGRGFQMDAKGVDTMTADTITLNGVERDLTPAEQDSFREFRIQKITQYTLILGGLILLTFIATFFQTYALNYVGQSVIYRIRSDLFSHLEDMDLRFYERNPVGRLVTRMTNDLNNINELYTNVIVTVLSDVAIVIGSITMMITMNVRLALITLSVMPIMVVLTIIFRTQVRKAYRVVRVKLAQINATLNENFMGMKTIQIFNQEKKFVERFDVINEEYRQASQKELYIYSIFRPLINFLYFFSTALALVFGGFMVLEGEILVGVVVAMTLYIRQLFRPIMELAEKFNILQSAMSSIERIFQLFDEEPGLKDYNRIPIKPLKGEVQFKDVHFSYNPGEPVLRGISFTAKPGETIAFVGATGSGKSTIINLLTRLYDVDSGSIILDGENIKDYPVHELREKVIPVLQDVFLFSGNIRDNIRLLNEDISDEAIMEAARFVNADRFINKFDDGLDHEVTEGGQTLSSGERQLLSFARAIVHDPDILILDEATSNIDTETEVLIQQAIERVVKERTTFVVAHRLSTIQNADKIIVIHKGEIREQGTHDDLLAQGGLYYDLYQLQYQEANIE